MFCLILITILSLTSIIKSKELNQTILFETYGYSVDSTIIDLNGQSIDIIDNDTFKYYTKLQILYLDDNKLKSINNLIFKDLNKLNEIWIESNNIIQLDKNAFIGLNNLKLICLNNNPISDMFPNKLTNLCQDCQVKINDKCTKKTSTGTTISIGNKFKANNCYQLYLNGIKSDGIYDIYPDNENESIKVFCEMHKGGWTRIMNKINNSTTAFNKSWNEYTNGFGDFDSNNWLGLNYIRQLTNQQQMSIRIEVSNDITDSSMIEYDSFFIGPEKQKFQLTIGKKIFGSLEDSFTHHNGMKFATFDQDAKDLCSIVRNGGWWFKACYQVCLTCQNDYAGQWCSINGGGCSAGSQYPYYSKIKMLIKPFFD
jgi:hypothetical protein